ncbi:MAG: radical SAM protein [Deltaproteobacteria bacterium]|nr:radical SAM protein [Deltaproteobacteria bacterium]
MTLNYEVIHGLDFTAEEIADCLKREGLLSLELEFSKICNLRCIYCYANAGEALPNELTLSDVKNVIDQAAELGAKKIILLGGGEPLMYEGIQSVVEYIHNKGLKQSVFTNGMLLTKELAHFLFDCGVSVIVKHNSNIPEVQDKLAGVKGAFNKIQQGFEYLIEAGYPHREGQLGIQTVICCQNLKEIHQMWTWARERGIMPYFEIITNQGRAKEHKELKVTNEEIRKVFEELEYIDETRFGHTWSPHPTIASFTCKRHLYSCLVNSQGSIQPCTGIDMPVGNVKQEKLKDILKKSSVIQKLRNIYSNIEGECKTCEFAFDCYGCRGNAYQITGNYLASDPACWLNKKAKKVSPPHANPPHICQ